MKGPLAGRLGGGVRGGSGSSRGVAAVESGLSLDPQLYGITDDARPGGDAERAPAQRGAGGKTGGASKWGKGIALDGIEGHLQRDLLADPAQGEGADHVGTPGIDRFHAAGD
ncbi:hypothetical protein G6F59_018443 [Rhizopus arrhizus]|nr:hypothetical protein G6F59_018443 [Rhizopus arrhizus]